MIDERGSAEEGAREYWRRFEAELGESIIARTMGQRFESPGDRGSWGLLVLTPTRLIYRKMPSESWVSSLFRAQSVSSQATQVEDSSTDLADILGTTVPKGSLMDRLFGTPFSVFTVSLKGREGAVRFAVDPKAGLLEALRERLAIPTNREARDLPKEGA